MSITRLSGKAVVASWRQHHIGGGIEGITPALDLLADAEFPEGEPDASAD